MIEYRIRDITLVTTPAHELLTPVGFPVLVGTIPEPSALTLMLCGGSFLACLRAQHTTVRKKR